MFGNAEWPHIRAALRTHFPRSVVLDRVAASVQLRHDSALWPVSSPLIAAQSKVTFLAPSRALLSWGMHVSRICGISSPLLLSRRASVTSGLLMTGSALFGPCSLIDGYVRWTPLLLLLVPPGVVLPLATPRAPARLLCPPERFHEFSGWDTAYVRDTVVVLSPDTSANCSWLGLWHSRANQRVPATCCAPPPREWTTHPLNSC